jgi:PRTRC genetic system protein B
MISVLHTNQLKGVLAVYDKYVSYHPYDNQSIGAGQPLTKDTCENLFQFLFKEDFANAFFFENMIPKNVLKYKENEKLIVWYTKPTKKYMSFLSNLPIEDGTYPLPYLVWKLNGNSLNVYATTKEPNQPNTKLFHAPFLNVGANGDICMGSSKFISDSNDYQEIIAQAEKGFFSSVFTHTNHDNILSNQSIVTMYQQQKSTSNKNFETTQLNPINTTLKDICND